MALGFQQTAGGGDFLPVVKYDARAGRMFRVDREDGQSTNVDITKGFVAVVDMENIEVGFIRFMAGAAPDFQLVPLGQQRPAPRSAEHKQGVRFLVKLPTGLGGDVREIASTANVFINAFDRLHDDYEAGKGANPGKLPVVELVDTTPIKAGKGDKQSTNYAPVFRIKSWAPRPVDLVPSPRGGAEGLGAIAATLQAAQAEAPRATPPDTGATRVTPPAPQRTPEPVAAAGDDMDFG